MKTVLIIGKNGQVSTYLQNALKGNFEVVVAERDQIDLSKLDQIQPALQKINPSLIINPAAFTAVDLAEDESELAFTINRDAVKELATYCSKTQTPLIHFSTDYVFAGDAEAAYTEIDQAAPTGVYGESKLAGEKEALKSGAPAIVLRTSWVYSNHGKNFYKTMLALAATRNELSVVADQVGAPTYAGSIAEATKKLVEIIFNQGQIEDSQKGVYHLTCGGQTSWAEFAKAIFVENQKDAMTVNSITTDEYPTPAKRPAFSVLNNDKLQAVFGVSLPTWQDALGECVEETKLGNNK